MMHFAMSKGTRKTPIAIVAATFVALVVFVSTTSWSAVNLINGDTVHSYVIGKGLFSGYVTNVSITNDDEEFVVMIRGRGLRGHASHHSSSHHTTGHTGGYYYSRFNGNNCGSTKPCY